MTQRVRMWKWVGTGLISFVVLSAVGFPRAWAQQKARYDLPQILSRMDASGKRLKSVSADINYTKVTILVDDKSTEAGRIFFRNPKSPEVLINFTAPDPKVILLKKDKAEMYLPKINQVQEYDLSRHQGVVQQFLLLGFGTESGDLQKGYQIKYVSEDELDHNMTVVLELTPRSQNVASQLAKIRLWVSEESWVPVQQEFYEPDGDYAIAHYSSMKINQNISSSIFRIPAAKDAKRVKM